MPILLSLFFGQPLLLPLLLGFCGPSCLHFPVELDETHVQTHKLRLCVLHLLDGLVGLLIGLRVEQRCWFWGHGGGQEEKRYSLLSHGPPFYPPVPLVATPEDTVTILSPC